MVDATALCAACHGSNPRFRCTSCRSAWYCCRACQQRDWKRHRRYCRATTELAAMLQQVTPGQAEQEYYKTKDRIESLLLDNDRHPERVANGHPSSSESSSSTPTHTRQASLDSLDSGREGQVPEVLTALHEAPQEASRSSNATTSFRIHHMPNLSCYQVQVGDGTAATHVAWDVDELESCLEASVDSESTRWVLRRRSHEALLSLLLPGSITDVTVYDEAPTQCFKLSYEPQSARVLVHDKRSKISVSDVPAIKCRSCRAPLMDYLSRDGVAVSQVLPLHSGQFHEMMDYLICYPGQPAVDVGSNSLFPAASHVALEDETSIVLHGQERSCAWTVLAIAGYGDDPNEGSETSPTDPKLDLLDNSAARRGSRPWRDWVGGATLTCATCAIVLGYATMGEETLATAARLLKHRIVWSSSVSDQQRYNVADFIMNEMIRYAETKAIFCFQVICEGSTDCLLIRLMSWESQVATHRHGSTSECKSLNLEWHRFVQVLYEESTISAAATDEGDALNWMWTKDWCCPPVKKLDDVARSPPEPPASLVRIFFSLDEYVALQHELQSASGWFSDALRLATILSKAGQGTTNVRVAAIML